jgi:lipopolysaccharide/colanic/teichoic acid biosynthesis glycosyltransferase
MASFPPRVNGAKFGGRRDHSFDHRSHGIAAQDTFTRMLSLERKRTERTGDPLLLVLFRLGSLVEFSRNEEVPRIVASLTSAIRDTDITGWYEYPSTLGVIFTALKCPDRKAVKSAILFRIHRALEASFEPNEMTERIQISLHFYPEDNGDGPGLSLDDRLYPDLRNRNKSRSLSSGLKRVLDIAGSLFAIFLFSPLFLMIPVLIKLTSPGPVLFKQQRLSKFARQFTFLKFRSMYVNNDPEIHRRYAQALIRQQEQRTEAAGLSSVYKMTNDPRVTRIGRFLRKTSLDELPQFINVLKGDMSLVGPRPPIPYEFEDYDTWHRRRVLEAKPGITGLWQVLGRSRTTFDEMVRLDLQYIRDQSFWLDLKILVKTPAAVLSGSGAY